MKFTLTTPVIQLALYLVLVHQVAGRAVPAHPEGDDNVAHTDHQLGHPHTTGHHHDDGLQDINVLVERAPVPPARIQPRPGIKKSSRPVPAPVVSVPKKEKNSRPQQVAPLRGPPRTPLKTLPQKKVNPPPPLKKTCPLPSNIKQKNLKNPKGPLRGPRVAARNIWYALTRRAPSTDTCANQKFTVNCAAEPDAALDIDPEGADEAIELFDGDNSVIDVSDLKDLDAPPPSGDPLVDALDGLDVDDFDFGDAIRALFEEEDKQATTQPIPKKRTYKRAVKFSCTAKVGLKEQLLYPPTYPTPNDILKDATLQQGLARGWWVDTARMKDPTTASNCDPSLMNQKALWGLEKVTLNAAKLADLKAHIKDFHTEHAYEINFIPAFLDYLMKKHGVSCDHILKFFFHKPRGLEGLSAKYGYRGSLSGRLMDQLGSKLNMGGLAVLDKDVNTLKHRVLRRDPIVSLAKFKAASLDQKITTFRRLVQVMEYMKATTPAFRDTKTYVEKELIKFDAAITKWTKKDPINAQNNPFKFKLQEAHNTFIEDLIAEANRKTEREVKSLLGLIIAHSTEKKDDWAKLAPEVQTIFTDLQKQTLVRSFLSTFAL